MLDIDKLKAVDLTQSSNVLKNEIVEKTKSNELVKKVNAIQGIENFDLIQKADFNSKIQK